MRISDSLVEKLLKASGKITDAQYKTLKEQEKTEKKPLQDLAIKSNIISEKELTKLYADEIDVAYTDLAPDDITPEVLKSIPEHIAGQYRAVVFAISKDGTKSLAIEDPDDIQAVSFLQKRLGTDLKVFIAPASQIQAALDQYRGNFAGEITKVASAGGDDLAEEEVSEDEVAEDSPIAQTVNLIIEYGVKSGASDIHIEPRENHVVIRYRIDGILREANKLPRKVLASLVSRIKILSNLKIDEHRAPQDGRFKVQFAGHVFALRVSTLPIVDGEKVVMRILNESSKPASLEELGYWGISLRNIQNAITQPHGMILVTGPTGSGKSTSLFSALSILNSPSVNISTIEDPIEYKIVGANQTQVNVQANMTFSSGLRALLRQDPNIIMVGEIRDSETASLGVQAALTGHLVFSTLHTNNAATCLPRLLDMGIEPFLIASTMRVVVGQRLLRRLCPQCRESYTPERSVLDDITKVFRITSPEAMKRIHSLEQEAMKEGIGAQTAKGKQTSKTPELATTETTITVMWKAHEGGCETCNHTGYKGRVGIYEVLSSSEKVQNLIINNATSDTIQAAAIDEGMVTMQIDGLIKALRGETTVEEIMRVTADS